MKEGLQMYTAFQNIKWIILCVIIISIGFVSNCAKKTTEEQETILATIGNQSITVKEFEMRTELTIRPKYPALNDDEVKRIYLNDLIAEKLMALEGQQEKALIDNPIFQAHIKGIQEQKMREQLYNNEVSACAQLDSNIMKQVYLLAGREYSISYYSVNNDSLANKLNDELNKDPQLFEPEFHQHSSLNKIPHKLVKFKDPDPVILNDSLFSKPLEVGQVIGPVKIESNNYIVMRVDNWKFYPAIGTSDIANRWMDVKKKLTERNSYYTWRNYKTKLMNGKHVDFERDTFNQLSKIFFTIYSKNDSTLKRKIYSEFLTDDTNKIHFEYGMFKDLLLDYPFFTVDGAVWTVKDFRDTYMSYPLIFQDRPTNLKDFQRQFRDAILSMICDHFLTKEAYKQNLDKDPIVQHTRALWEDAYVAMFHKDQYLKKIHERDDFDPKLMNAKNGYLVMYVDSLQQKYGPKITINEAALKGIKLSTIDMFAIQPNMPYPVAVPGFPEYTQDSNFDYAHAKQAK